METHRYLIHWRNDPDRLINSDDAFYALDKLEDEMISDRIGKKVTRRFRAESDAMADIMGESFMFRSGVTFGQVYFVMQKVWDGDD